MRYTSYDWIAAVLIIIGAINWGLVGLFKFNLVDTLFGKGSFLSRLIYILVGLAGLYMIYTLTRTNAGVARHAK